jgi:hypothetical protein
MKRTLYAKRPDQRGSIAISLAVHVVVIAMIASITFSYEFSSSAKDREPVAERVQYVAVKPRPPEPIGNGAKETRPQPKKAVSPAKLLPPTTIPTAIPPIPPPNVSAGAISGSSKGTGGAPVGVATGIEPAMPDPRIELRPNGLHIPLSQGEKNDSAVKAIYVAYREAELAAEANRGRSPRDWTMERNGQKYGLDSQYIYLGKFKLPSAILAALPLNFNRGGVDGSRIIQARNASWIQNDIYSHAQGLSEDDFRAAIKRIRERVDRERKEAEEKDKASKATPIVP